MPLHLGCGPPAELEGDAPWPWQRGGPSDRPKCLLTTGRNTRGGDSVNQCLQAMSTATGDTIRLHLVVSLIIVAGFAAGRPNSKIATTCAVLQEFATGTTSHAGQAHLFQAHSGARTGIHDHMS